MKRVTSQYIKILWSGAVLHYTMLSTVAFGCAVDLKIRLFPFMYYSLHLQADHGLIPTICNVNGASITPTNY